jgi:ABC-type nitrate/sulfonate/bicarbonate transport system substrate-binding protein
MTDVVTPILPTTAAPERIWYTRCPVPTASGIAGALGWLDEEFGKDGLKVGVLQDAPPELLARFPDYDLPGLFREGGNIPALVARGNGAPTRLIGLTWIDEWQAILVRPETGPITPADLRGMRVALPAYSPLGRGRSIARGMSLAGIKGALAVAGLGLQDVTFIEVPLAERVDDPSLYLQRLWSGIGALARGEVDAVYVKGASAAEAAKEAGVVVGIDLDGYPSRLTRVNNGTPRPVTVHQDLLDHHFDLVVRYLEQSLRAADWAANNLAALRRILQTETKSGPWGVEAAYRSNFHRSLHPSLSAERIDLLKSQANFLWLHGFTEHPVDVDRWIDPRPLAEALERFATRRAA